MLILIAATIFQPIFLQELPGASNDSQATCINAQSQVVGSSGALAVFWASPDAAPLALQSLGDAVNTVAVSVNDAQQIVGYDYTSASVFRPLYWASPSSPPRILAGIGGSYAEPWSINIRGEIVGQSQGPDGNYYAVYWSSPAAAGRVLPAIAGPGQSAALGINDAGEIVGSGANSNATYWANGDAQPVNLGGLDSAYSFGVSINANHQIVGFGDDAGNQRAVYWSSPSALPIDLGAVYGSSSAASINDAGQVAGYSNGHSAWWSGPAAHPQDIAARSGFEYSQLNSVNVLGQIAGNSSATGYGERALVWMQRTVADDTPPVSSLSFPDGGVERFGVFFVSAASSVLISAADADSGVREIDFALDGAQLLPGGAGPVALSLSEGTHDLAWLAIDNAGNVEATHHASFFVRKAYPFVAASGGSASGQASLLGDLAADAPFSFSGQASDGGCIFAPALVLSEKAGPCFTATATPVSAAPYDLALLTTALTPATLAATNGVLRLSGKESMTLPSGSYSLNGIELSGQAQLHIGGPVALFVHGAISVTGQAMINDAQDAFALSVFVDTAQTITVSGGAQLAAAIYAPRSSLTLSGSAHAYGSLFANTLSLSGSATAIGAGRGGVPADPAGP